MLKSHVRDDARHHRAPSWQPSNTPVPLQWNCRGWVGGLAPICAQSGASPPPSARRRKGELHCGEDVGVIARGSTCGHAIARARCARASRRGLSAVERGGSGSRGSATVASWWYTLGGHPGISLERGSAGLHKTPRCETSLDRLGRVALPAHAQGEHGLRDSVEVNGGLLGEVHV